MTLLKAPEELETEMTLCFLLYNSFVVVVVVILIRHNSSIVPYYLASKSGKNLPDGMQGMLVPHNIQLLGFISCYLMPGLTDFKGERRAFKIGCMLWIYRVSVL